MLTGISVFGDQRWQREIVFNTDKGEPIVIKNCGLLVNAKRLKPSDSILEGKDINLFFKKDQDSGSVVQDSLQALEETFKPTGSTPPLLDFWVNNKLLSLCVVVEMEYNLSRRLADINIVLQKVPRK